MSDSDKDRVPEKAAGKSAASKASAAGKAARGEATPKPSKTPATGRATARKLTGRRRRSGEPATQKVTDQLNPVWWVPSMVTLMVLGLAWLVVSYLTQTGYPIPDIAGWNLAIGFVMIMVGFLMTTRWR